MKICWDNLEEFIYNKEKGYWSRKYLHKDKPISIVYFYKESCKFCGEPFFSRLKEESGNFCSYSCAASGREVSPETRQKLSKRIFGEKNWHYRKPISEEQKKKMREGYKKYDHSPLLGRKILEETKRKIGLANKGKHRSEGTKQRMRETRKNENHPNWKGGVKAKNIPLFDTYAHQISWCEPVRRDPKDEKILQVKCTYCGKWYNPKTQIIWDRIKHFDGRGRGEQRFYCSSECKHLCPIYGQKTRYKFQDGDYTREVQAELRQLVFERDDWNCIKCNNTKELHCHHVEGIRWNPLESADIDTCVTFCKSCHEEVHKQKGCRKIDMKCKEEINL